MSLGTSRKMCTNLMLTVAWLIPRAKIRVTHHMSFVLAVKVPLKGMPMVVTLLALLSKRHRLNHLVPTSRSRLPDHTPSPDARLPNIHRHYSGIHPLRRFRYSVTRLLETCGV